MMMSGDEMAIKTLEAVLGREGWEDDAGKLMVGVAQRQRRGHWDTTPANAWGATVVRRFAELYPASAITGTTRVSLAGGGDRKSVVWGKRVSVRVASGGPCFVKQQINKKKQQNQ